MKKTVFIISLILFSLLGSKIEAVQPGEIFNFYTENSYDISGRAQVTAYLVKITPRLYFYIDKAWWDAQGYIRQSEISNSLGNLAQEFESKIYPYLTSAFGSEWKPGIDGDEKITVLFHPMKEEMGGYFRSNDEYLRLQFPNSNEREMVYLNVNQIESLAMKSFLAHEFLHLITFNLKNRILGVGEETWLNEARADYTSTFLGYDDIYEGSNLQKRVKSFSEAPSDPLTEWKNKKADYGVISLFTQYLIDHYGINILIDSLFSEKSGITALNEALVKNGFKDDFSQIFTNWTVTVVLNDCGFGFQYCYLNKNLKTLRISPLINFLPLTGKSTLSLIDVTKNWSGNWYKFIGGRGVLKFEFNGLAGLNFKVPYLIQDKEGKYALNFLDLDEKQKGEIYISDFGGQNKSLIIIPSLQSKISASDGLELTYPISLTASIELLKFPKRAFFIFGSIFSLIIKLLIVIN